MKSGDDSGRLRRHEPHSQIGDRHNPDGSGGHHKRRIIDRCSSKVQGLPLLIDHLILNRNQDTTLDQLRDNIVQGVSGNNPTFSLMPRAGRVRTRRVRVTIEDRQHAWHSSTKGQLLRIRRL